MTRAQLEHQRGDVDPTNLYFTNLHKDVDEAQVWRVISGVNLQLTTIILHALAMSGEVVSCRVLRDEQGGVARCLLTVKVQVAVLDWHDSTRARRARWSLRASTAACFQAGGFLRAAVPLCDCVILCR